MKLILLASRAQPPKIPTPGTLPGKTTGNEEDNGQYYTVP
jgi:hypothetical protein